jgi:hypothetical protein
VAENDPSSLTSSDVASVRSQRSSCPNANTSPARVAQHSLSPSAPFACGGSSPP